MLKGNRATQELKPTNERKREKFRKLECGKDPAVSFRTSLLMFINKKKVKALICFAASGMFSLLRLLCTFSELESQKESREARF